MTEDGGQRRRIGPVAWLLAGLVRLYQLVLSPWLPPSCRFEPSCSAYALEALRGHGALRGGWLTVRRLGRCHPFCVGGYDPVPEPRLRQARWFRGGGAKAGSPASSLVPAARLAHGEPESVAGAVVARSAAPTPPTPTVDTPTLTESRKSPVASGSPDRGVPSC